MLMAVIAAFSFATGATVDRGEDAVALLAGWPAISANWLHGVSDGGDAGARLELLYNGEGQPGTEFTVGLGAAVPLRYALSRGERSWVTLEAAPGVRTFVRSPFEIRLRAPIGVAFGTSISPRTSVAFRPEIAFEHALVNSQVSRGNLLLTLGVALETVTRSGLHLGIDLRAGGAYVLYPLPMEGTGSRFGWGTLMVSIFLGGSL